MANLKDQGVKRANTNASADNFAQLQECGEGAACQDRGTATIASDKKVTAITIDGTEITLSTSVDVDDPSGIEDAIVAELDEVEPNVTATYSGGDLTVEHVGEQTLSKVTTDGTDMTLNRYCDTYLMCDYTADALDNVTTVNYGSNSDNLANGPHAYSGNSGTDSSTASTIEADLDAIFDTRDIFYDDITVTVDDTNNGFDIAFTAALEHEMDIDGESPLLTAGSCDNYWTS